MNKSTLNQKVILYICHILLAFIVLFPLLFALTSSFRPLEEIFKYVSPVTWKSFIPTTVTFDAYIQLFTERGFGRVLFNTIFVTVVTVFFAVIFNSMAAFAFAFFRFKGSSFLFFIVILTFLVPFEIIAIPLYNVVDFFGWINSYKALIIPGIANGLVIFLYRQFFLGIPISLIESCRIDGASWLRVYAQIVMPLSKPVSVTAGLLVFIFQWESFLWPLIATRTHEYKLIQVAMGDFTTELGTYWNEMFAAVIISVIFPVVVLLLLQKYFIQGVSTSGSKE
jgi:multiple sugar transport system permease protein/putative chitobiose transport system permease protein